MNLLLVKNYTRLWNKLDYTSDCHLCVSPSSPVCSLCSFWSSPAVCATAMRIPRVWSPGRSWWRCANTNRSGYGWGAATTSCTRPSWRSSSRTCCALFPVSATFSLTTNAIYLIGTLGSLLAEQLIFAEDTSCTMFDGWMVLLSSALWLEGPVPSINQDS